MDKARNMSMASGGSGTTMMTMKAINAIAVNRSPCFFRRSIKSMFWVADVATRNSHVRRPFGHTVETAEGSDADADEGRWSGRLDGFGFVISRDDLGDLVLDFSVPAS